MNEIEKQSESAQESPAAPQSSAPVTAGSEAARPVDAAADAAEVESMGNESPAVVVEESAAPTDPDQKAVKHALGEVQYSKTDFGWYILHTLSGNEEKVKQNMKTLLDREGLGGMMEDILIPVEDIVEVKKGGKKRIKKRKLFPGYVFVRMKATEQVLKQIRHVPNLARFVGGIGGSGPVPVTDSEIDRIRNFMTITKERPKIIYEVGETVRIINGPFMDFNGTILEIDVDRGRLKIQVEIFGRATPVDLDFDQVEKV